MRTANDIRKKTQFGNDKNRKQARYLSWKIDKWTTNQH